MDSTLDSTEVVPVPIRKKKKNVPVRKRLKAVKRHVKKVLVEQKQLVGTVTPVICGESTKENTPETPPQTSPETSRPTTPETSLETTPETSLQTSETSMNTSESTVEISMDTSESTVEISMDTSESTVETSSASSTPEPPEQSPLLYDAEMQRLLLEVRGKLFCMLPELFFPVVDNKGIHVLMIGRRESKAVQREVFVSYNGHVRIEVHGKEYPERSAAPNVPPSKPLTAENLAYFVDRILYIVSSVRLLEICAGADKQEFKEAWHAMPNGEIESDTFKECRYSETCRSKKCELLVSAGTWRCKECKNLQGVIKRAENVTCDCPQSNTNNRYLTDKQKKNKLEVQHKTIKLRNKTIDRLQERISELIAKEGVQVSADLSKDLEGILRSSNLSPKQSKFFQQQLQASNCKKSCGMRWHPTMIRLALSIYLRSPSAYEVLQESGFIKLPTSRTLYDYSHATKIEYGIDNTILESLAKRVASENLKHPQYHVVMADEIYVSKHLVIVKSTGEIIGFKDLDKIDQEVAILEALVDDSDKKLEPEMASKILAFMVKGCSSKVKDVVAFPVCNPSAKQMYVWTWEVIGALERCGIKVLAFVCDGASSNRAFIKLHTPVTTSDIIFDTVNKFAPERVLYFFSDVPHLLKTIRNAFFNSRKNKKGVRCLRKCGEHIVWDTIIRLYLSKKDKTRRKSYKLNPQNVYPDSYTKMKVAPAAEVLSNTISNDIASQGWPGTAETVEFIKRTNDWFDLLNGAFIKQGIKTQNPRLNAYTKKDVEEYENNVEGNRFQQILDYIQYHSDWREEVISKMNVSLDFDDLGVHPLGDVSFHALPEEEVQDPNPTTETPAERDFSMLCLLPHQTLLGIEMSSKSFIGAVTFLMKQGVPFVNARAFCQDPLEQNFGKQRMGGGGSCNPNVSQFYHKQRAIHTIGQLGTTKRKFGNTEVLDEDADLNDAPLPKRKKTKNVLS